jgi:hypothetical protein
MLLFWSSYFSFFFISFHSDLLCSRFSVKNWIKAASETQTTDWCFVSLVSLPHLWAQHPTKSQGMEKKHKQTVCYGVKGAGYIPMPNRVLISIWNLISIAFTVHIPACILVFWAPSRITLSELWSQTQWCFINRATVCTCYMFSPGPLISYISDVPFEKRIFFSSLKFCVLIIFIYFLIFLFWWYWGA